MVNFYIFRHGQTEWNKERRLQGLADNALNSTGLKQARELASLLKEIDLDLLVASPLKRAQQTVEIVAQALALPVVTDKRLREVDLGEADGMTLAEFKEKFGDEYLTRFITSGRKEDIGLALPDGELKSHALSRALTALLDIAQSPTSKHIGVCCHGLIMMLLLRHSGYEGDCPVSNGDLVQLVFADGKLSFKEYFPNKIKTLGIFGY